MKKFLPASLLAIYICALFAVAEAQSRSLDGPWQFAVDREGKLTINDLTSVKDWREIQVPLSWNVQFADLRDYRGVAWYRKTVDLKPIKPDQTVLFEEITPKFVIEGVKTEDYDDVMSGIFLGWVNKNAALMVGGQFGGAHAIITTFRIADAYGKDEYARRLLDEMIRLVSSEGFEPKLAIE